MEDKSTPFRHEEISGDSQSPGKRDIAPSELESTKNHGEALRLDKHGLPLVPQPSIHKDDPLVGYLTPRYGF